MRSRFVLHSLAVALLVPLVAAGVAVVGPASLVPSATASVPGAATSQVAGLAGSAALAPPARTKRLRYVALGDSYSAASGVLPLDPTSPMCLRSTRNYPNVIAQRTGARLSDVTCGAADTGDYRGAQYPGVAPQLKALRRSTQLVTMTIGGNDSSVFINSILQCGALGVASLGQGAPCRRRYGSSFADTVRDKTFPSIRRALRDVRRKAPKARVAILGYPAILPAKSGCFPQMPVAKGDVPYLHRLQDVLNNAVRRAAEQAGAIYVDVPTRSKGHDACQAIGTRWVEPVLAGTNPVIVHPNALGERAMARITMRRLGLR